jgi:hypothetical protein
MGPELYSIFVTHFSFVMNSISLNNIVRNCLLQHVIEGNMEARTEVTGRRGKRCKQQLDDVKEKRGDWKLTEEELDCFLWVTHFGRCYGPATRQAME